MSAAATLAGGGGAVLLAAAGSAWALRHNPRGADRCFRGLVLAGAGLAATGSLLVLRLAARPAAPTVFLLNRGLWAFGLDGLSAWFLLLVAGVGGVIAAYGVPYLALERGHPAGSAAGAVPDRAVGAHALVGLLLSALTGVVTAQSTVAFLASWEVMAVSAYLLVVFDRRDPEVRRAGLLYLVLTHLSTLALFAMFAAGLSFGSGPPPAASLSAVLVFALLGFGIKAGAVPLHFWLPGAHAAAPSHVSALLSGVMLKTGIYGLLRVILLSGTPPAWFGWTLLVAGIVSGILGVVWALAQHDLKRLLAYHSVENIGIILLGMGVGALGLRYGHPVAAALGFAGALLHALNHALFKSLLFLAAGAVGRATGTRMIDRLGGLARQLPLTALAFGIGAAAIVGLPPLNGFVSEWLVFTGALQAATAPTPLRLAAAGAAALALIGGLALACFAKVTGTMFLGHPRAPDRAPGHDPTMGMGWPMLGLALACAAIGLVPGAVLPLVAGVVRTLAPSWDGLAGPLAPGPATGISGVGLLLTAAAALALLVRRGLRETPRPARAATWGCAGPAHPSRAQYTASSFAAPLLAPFGGLARHPPERGPARFAVHPIDPVLDGVVRPVWRRVDAVAHWMRGIPSGRIRWYLLAVVFTLLVLLLRLVARGAPA